MFLRLLSTALIASTSTEAFAPQTLDSRSATILHSTLASSPTTIQLDHADAWIEKLDYDGFSKEVTALGKELQKNTGPVDVEHLHKIVSWRNIAAALGVSTMWMPTNPITVLALSTWTYASWTMVAHHTCHGGYNRVDAGKFNSRGFALGSVRKRIEGLFSMITIDTRDM